MHAEGATHFVGNLSGWEQGHKAGLLCAFFHAGCSESGRRGLVGNKPDQTKKAGKNHEQDHFKTIRDLRDHRGMRQLYRGGAPPVPGPVHSQQPYQRPGGGPPGAAVPPGVQALHRTDRRRQAGLSVRQGCGHQMRRAGILHRGRRQAGAGHRRLHRAFQKPAAPACAGLLPAAPRVLLCRPRRRQRAHSADGAGRRRSAGLCGQHRQPPGAHL